MNLSLRNTFLWLFCIAISLSSCQKKWEEHNDINDPLLGENLLSQINKNPELSKFSEYLSQTGYDQVLASSKSFTVWAPTNAALQAVDASAINTPEKLQMFVANHIANQAFLTTNIKQDLINVKTLNGKNVTFGTTKVDESTLISKDRYVGNGVLHTISTAIIPKLNAWEYLMSTNTLQKQFMQRLNYSFIDFTKAEQIGINPTTGEPVYKEGTGVLQRNRYLDRQVNDFSNEDSLVTYIVLTDNAFNAERNKLSKYYASGDSTDSITRFNVVKDLVFRGLLDSENFPQSVYSVGDSVRFHLNKNHIVETHRVSNGIVYVMNNLDYDLGVNGVYDRFTKIKPIIIQGEQAAASLTNVNVGNSTRLRRNPNTQEVFRDIFVQNHARANFWLRYNAPTAYSTKYKVYWVAVNDFQDVKFPMRVAFKRDTFTDFMALKEVNTNDYSEVYLGEYTVDKLYSISTASKQLPVFLVGANTTANGLNTVVLDYIKMIPVQ